MIEEETIRSLSEYIQIIEDLESDLIFRGQGNSSWPLIPSIGRLYSSEDIDDLGSKFGSWQLLEREIQTEFKRKAIPFLSTIPINDVDWMVLGQHYGLPTRLLDWTFNPLVALFFALSTKEDSNSCVWGACIETSYSINVPLNSTGYLLKLSPKQIDQRIIAQNGCFTVHPLPDDIIPVDPIENIYNRKDEGVIELIKINIPDEDNLKEEILIQLERLGVDNNYIYPDLTGLCKQLKTNLFRE